MPRVAHANGMQASGDTSQLGDSEDDGTQPCQEDDGSQLCRPSACVTVRDSSLASDTLIADALTGGVLNRNSPDHGSLGGNTLNGSSLAGNELDGSLLHPDCYSVRIARAWWCLGMHLPL